MFPRPTVGDQAGDQGIGQHRLTTGKRDVYPAFVLFKLTPYKLWAYMYFSGESYIRDLELKSEFNFSRMFPAGRNRTAYA